MPLSLFPHSLAFHSFHFHQLHPPGFTPAYLSPSQIVPLLRRSSISLLFRIRTIRLVSISVTRLIFRFLYRDFVSIVCIPFSFSLRGTIFLLLIAPYASLHFSRPSLFLETVLLATVFLVFSSLFLFHSRHLITLLSS